MEEKEEIQNAAKYCLNCIAKPCTKKCPLGNNIPAFIQSVKAQNYQEAFNILQKTTVLPAICGKICPFSRQCQGNCVRGIKGEPVQIGKIESFVGDFALKNNCKIECKNRCKNQFVKKVAVIGSGPAGLTCAAFLAKEGIDATIYEKHSKLGGLLRYGIPEFRLSKKTLENQIKQILNLGIKVETNKELEKDYTLNELCQKYDAVFLGIGANIPRKMNIPGENSNCVYGGNQLLETGTKIDCKNKKIAVIGGGNVAIDVARTVKRKGAKDVYIIYRRAEEQMPADKTEINEAKKENIEFLFQNNILKIEKAQNKNQAKIECIKTKLVQKEKNSRAVPENIEGSNYTKDVDYVIMAIGSKPEKELISKLNLKLTQKGYIEINENYQTSNPKVYAGGDIAEIPATVAWAARSGRDAAKAILQKKPEI